MPASPTPSPGARSSPAATPRLFRPVPQAFLNSVMPALDRAFGLDFCLEGEPGFPEEIAVLVARLQADPSGVPAEVSEAAREAVPA